MPPLRLVSTSLEVFCPSGDGDPVFSHAIASDHPHIGDIEEQKAAAATCYFDELLATIVTPYTDQSILELRAFHLRDSRPNQAAHQLIFPAPILNSIYLGLAQSNTLVLQICTQSGVIYRILLPLALLESVDDIPSRWISEHRLSNIYGTALEIYKQGLLTDMNTSEDGSVSLISCTDGRVIKAVWEEDHTSSERISGVWQESILRLDNFFSRFFGRSAAASASPTQVLATSTYNRSNQWKHTLGFTISRDRKLRVWDLGSDACIRIIDLPLSLDTLEKGQFEQTNASDSKQYAEDVSLFTTRPVLRSFADSEFLYLLVYIPAPLPCGNFLACYRVNFEGSAFAANKAGAASVGQIELVWGKACDAETRGWNTEIRDLSVIYDESSQRWNIWGLWDTSGEALVKIVEAFRDDMDWSSVSSPLLYLPLHGIALEEDLKAISRAEDLASLFMTRIIQPGRFSTMTLEEAVNDYQNLLIERHGKLPHLASASDFISVRDQIVALVGCTIELEENPSTGALLHDAHWNDLRKEWAAFINFVEERGRMESWPIAFTRGSVNLQIPFILSRGRLALPVPENASSERLRQVTMKKEMETNPVQSIDAVLNFAKRLMQAIDSADLLSFESELLRHLESQSSIPPEDIVDNLWGLLIQSSLEGQESLEEDYALLGSEEVKEAIFEVLRLVEAPPNTSSIQKSSQFPSQLELALCSDAITQMANDQLQLARLIQLLCIALYVGYLPMDDEMFNGGPSISDLVAETVAVYHRLKAFDLLAMADGAMELLEAERIDDEDDDDANVVVQEMENLQFNNGERTNLNSMASNLVHACLLRHRLGENGELYQTNTSFPKRISLFSADVLHKFLFSENAQLQPISLKPSLAQFANELIKSGYPTAAASFVRLFPRTPASHYILARYHMLSNEVEAAAIEFEQVVPAFSRLHEEQSEYGSGLLQLMSTSIREASRNAEARFHYYRRVTILYQHRGSKSHYYIAHFAKKAIDHAAMLDNKPDLRFLNEARFTSLLALKCFEDAYSHLIEISNLEDQRKYISDLISRMCDQGQVELLLSFNFASLQVEVVATLSFKARNSKTIEEIDFYFDLLYAFYIKRGDLKNAGATMWQMGTRLRQMAQVAQRLASEKVDEEYIIQLCVMEARCYLASINVLSQLDQRDAWFAHDTGGAQEDEAMVSKLTNYVPLSSINSTKTKDTLRIVKLQDIRTRYQIRLAQLEVFTSRSSQYSTSILMTDRNDANTTISLLVSNRDFERAFSLSRLLDIDRTIVYIALTDCCLQLVKREGQRLEQSNQELHPLIVSFLDDQDGYEESDNLLRPTNIDEGFLSRIDQCTTWKGSASSRAWRYLRLWLTMEEGAFNTSEDSSGHNLISTKYFLIVLDRILHWQQWDATPAWLKDWLRTNERELMIKSLLVHELYIAALQESLEMINSTTKSVGKITMRKRKLPGTSCELYLPYLLFDELLKRAEDAPLTQAPSNINENSKEVTTKSSSDSELMQRRKLANQVKEAIENHKEHLRKIQLQSIRQVNENNQRQRRIHQREIEEAQQREEGEDVAMQS